MNSYVTFCDLKNISCFVCVCLGFFLLFLCLVSIYWLKLSLYFGFAKSERGLGFFTEILEGVILYNWQL